MIVKKKRSKVETYEFTKIVPCSTYSTIKERAEELGKNPPRRCFKCGHEFSDNEIAYLGIAKLGKNQFFCEKCTQEAWNKEGM